MLHACLLTHVVMQVYLPMGYLYSARFVYPQAETDPLVLALRDELYCSTTVAASGVGG